MSKKTGIIIIISLLVILGIGISIYMPNKDKLQKETEDNTDISYYLLKNDEKYGVINNNGDIIIDAEYDEIVIPNINRDVFICTKEEKQKVLNSKKNEIFSQYQNISAIELSNVIAETTYEKNVLKYEENNKYGLIKIDGEIITKAIYDEISSLGYKNGEILVKENGKYGIINDKGNQIIKALYDEIISDQYYNVDEGYKKSGYIVSNTTDEGYRYGYYDYEGGEVLKVEYNQIMRLTQMKDSNNIYLIASKNGQFGVFVNNNKIINTQYQSITYDEGTNIFIVERTGKYGAINEKGLEILKTEYNDIQINGIYLYTKKDEENKVFDKNGQQVEINFNTVISATTNKDYYIKIEKDEEEQYSILNSDLKEITKQKYKYLEYLTGKYFIITNETGKSGIIDSDEKEILEPKYDLIQKIKDKNIIQVINFESNTTEIYNKELKKIVELKDMKIQKLDNYIKVYNDEEEYYLDNNGNQITDETKLGEIKKSNAILRIGNFKRVTYGVEQYYYIEEN